MLVNRGAFVLFYGWICKLSIEGGVAGEIWKTKGLVSQGGGSVDRHIYELITLN